MQMYRISKGHYQQDATYDISNYTTDEMKSINITKSINLIGVHIVPQKSLNPCSAISNNVISDSQIDLVMSRNMVKRPIATRCCVNNFHKERKLAREERETIKQVVSVRRVYNRSFHLLHSVAKISKWVACMHVRSQLHENVYYERE